VAHLFVFPPFGPQLAFGELIYAFAEDFKSYLTNTNLNLNRVGMTEVSTAGVIKKFRTIFIQAVEIDLISKNPFKAVKIKTKSPARDRLTIEQGRHFILS